MESVATVSVVSLWLPILIAAVLVFLTSWVIHMLLPYHRSDFLGLPSEDEVMEALRKYRIPPGDYVMPHAADAKARQSEEFIEKTKQGPIAMLTVMKGFAIGTSLLQWFVYCIVVGVFAGYLAGRAVPAGGDYLEVFQFAGTSAFLGYSMALLQNSIWYKRSWGATFKSVFDGLIYALLTAGVFGWLWP
ncbi:MAG TPA: hypothetical protein VMT85_00045 [Thermoanaerobaculia bacterium]|nr:hypothetical protein [Thermoanaerobaculia bacterium]